MQKRFAAVIAALMLTSSFASFTTFADDNTASYIQYEAFENEAAANSDAQDNSDADDSNEETLTDISEAVAAPIDDCEFTGSAVTPEIALTLGDATLVWNIDYTVAYSNNINPGTAAAVITGIGNYTGTLTVNFNIVMPVQQAVSKFANASATTNSIRLVWTSSRYATGYEVYAYNENRNVWSRITNTSLLYCDVKNLSAAEKSRYRIRAYRKIANRTVYSDYTELYTSTLPETISKLSISNVTTTDYTLKWDKISGADEYQVYLYDKNTTKWDLYGSTDSTSIKITNRRPGQKNTFRVRAVVKTGDTSQNGAYIKQRFTTKPEKVSGFRFTNTAKGYLTFSWDKVQNANKYQIWYATEKGGPYTLGKEVNGSKTSVKTGLMPTGRKYYFKIRAVSTVDDCTQNGACSSKVQALCFNKLSINAVLNSYSNSRSIKQVNAQGFTLSNTRINQLYSALTSLGGDAGYVLYDIDSGSTIAYNANTRFATASTVKLPYVTYCLREMEDGSPTLDTMLTYLPSDYNGGSSWIKYQPFYTQYSIRRVIQLIGDYSDNCGYYMMQDKFGYNGYNNYMRRLGSSSFISSSQRWGYVTSTDSARELEDLWKYLNTGRHRDFARSVFSTSCAANFRDQLGNRYTVYEKSGWTDTAYNETAIVAAEHPYVIICFSNRTNAQRMRNVAEISESIHKDMWNYYNKYVKILNPQK